MLSSKNALTAGCNERKRYTSYGYYILQTVHIDADY
jgi:hypothetical protein